MNQLAKIVFASIAVVSAATSSASSLTVSPNHAVLITDDEKKQQLRVHFADEQVLVDITLNVYVLEQLPSTRAHYAELQKLTAGNWLDAVQWSLVATAGGEIPLPPPNVLTNRVRHRGPDAAAAVDRDVAVPMTTYRAHLSFGSIPTGDFVLRAFVHGLESRFPFVVRSGNEPNLRDHYLRLKAMRTRDYAEFRRLQLERLERNPARVDALYDLIDRALVEGTAEEARAYFDRAIASVEAVRGKNDDARKTEQIDAWVRQLRTTRTALPQYFENRAKWVMTRDTKTGHYAIRNRVDGAVVRDFAPNP